MFHYLYALDVHYFLRIDSLRVIEVKLVLLMSLSAGTIKGVGFTLSVSSF